MESVKRNYKTIGLIAFSFTFAITLIVINSIKLINSRNNNINITPTLVNNMDNNAENITPTVNINKEEELNIGSRIPNETETIEIRSENLKEQMQVVLLRLRIENGEILNFESQLIALGVCDNSKTYTSNKVCADIAKTSPMMPNELLAKITIKWGDKKGKIIKEEGYKIATEESVLGENTLSYEDHSSEYNEEEIDISTLTNNKFTTDNINNNSSSFPFLFISLIAILLVFLVFKKLSKNNRFVKVFKIFVIVNFLVFSILSINYLQRDSLLPEESQASIPRVEINELYQPVLTVAPSNNFGRTAATCSSGYGWAICHTGVDLVIKQYIYSSGPGEVVVQQASRNSDGEYIGYGEHVVIAHYGSNSTFYTLYAHLEKAYVKVGQIVNQDTIIGMMGTTGNSTGIHLHFELRNHPTKYAENVFMDPTNIIFRKRGYTPTTQPGEDNITNPTVTSTRKNLACNEWCLSDNECAVTPPYGECAEFVDSRLNHCILLKCQEGQTLQGECSCVSNINTPSPTPIITLTPSMSINTPVPSINTISEAIICGPMDHNGNSKIDYLDLLNFSVKYNKNCSDSYTDNKYGGIDTNNDKIINYIDLAVFTKYYNKGYIF